MTDKSKALLAVADVANKYGILEGRAFDFAEAAIAAYTKAVSGEAVDSHIRFKRDNGKWSEWMTGDAIRFASIAAKREYEERPLFAAPQPAVPAGWKLVPVEPTEAMIHAATNCDVYWNYRGDGPSGLPDDVYAAMIEAAPEPEAGE